MRQVEVDDALIELAEAIIRGREVDVSAWARRGGTRGYCKPIGYESASSVLELIGWLAGHGLEYLCKLTNHHACRIRKRIGLIPSTVTPLTMAEIQKFHNSLALFRRWERARTEV